jgi:hypothetical protein
MEFVCGSMSLRPILRRAKRGVRISGDTAQMVFETAVLAGLPVWFARVVLKAAGPRTATGDPDASLREPQDEDLRPSG